MTRLIWPWIGGAFVLGHMGCGSTVVTDDDDGSGGSGECCLAAATCPQNTTEVTSCPEGGCVTVEVCCSEVLCKPNPPCYEPPICEAYETEVETCPAGWTCREVTACDMTILCAQEAFCDGYPSCDEGDIEMDSCPPDASCYTAEMCGYTILCLDAALPQHGCPPFPPAEGDFCYGPGEICDYAVGPSCFESYTCADGWTFVGGGCEE